MEDESIVFCRESDHSKFSTASPIYPMLTMAIQKACLNEIQRIQRSFIWGDSEAGRKFHAVNWMQVMKPKKFGGLGLRKLEVKIDACLLKLGWES